MNCHDLFVNILIIFSFVKKKNFFADLLMRVELINLFANDQVTEQVRSATETRLKEAAEQQRRLEEKLLEMEKEKQNLEEQKRSAVASLEEQVCDEFLQLM